ncbi:multidrug resistance-associated protein 1-like [Rhopilema esculentum]|uniref:multidrug resistance-associated protein 1-like n=1 Tax=Rhopilema esculentum TaxID=499914 RepID=UPI0031E4238A
MFSRKKQIHLAPKAPPQVIVALEDHDPYKKGNVYDGHPSFTTPSVDTQLVFRRGDQFEVISEQIDWWLFCKSSDSEKQGYVPSILFAPFCIETTDDRQFESNEDINHENVRLYPCDESAYIDLKYFPNAPDLLGKRKQEKPCPIDSANFLSRLTFWWMTGLIWTGYKRSLTSEDVWDLSKHNKAHNLVSNFQEKWDEEVRKLPRDEHIYENFNDSRDSGIDNKPEESQNIGPNSEVGFTDIKLNEMHNGEKKEENGAEVTSSLGKKEPFVEIKDAKGKKVQKEKKPSMWLVLAKCFGWTFFLGAILKFFHDVLLFVNPYLLRLIIQYVEGRGPQDEWRGYILALGLFLVATLQSMFLQQYFDKAVITGLRVRSAFLGIVYRKMLRLSNKGRSDFTTGEMVNLMSVDASKFQDITTYLNMVWSAPFQIITTLIFLYNLMGWSIFAGVAIMALLLPLNYFVSKKIKATQTMLMKQKDQRIKIMNDVLSGIKVVKLYAWEESFEAKIAKLRSSEMKLLRTFRLWKATTSFAFTCTPFLVSLGTFALYVLTGNELNAEKAFVAISLFSILQFPMTVLPDIISRIIQCQVSVGRLTNYLQAGDLDVSSVKNTDDNKDPIAVKVEHGSFSWGDGGFMLKNINLEVERGSLVAIVGQVGCGKSSLLSSFLGEMEKKHGTVTVNGKIAYVPQQAWIQNATLESNVLFGKLFNPKKYDEVIEACALKSDLEVLPGGDMTEIGEKGINLSGGQKQRVSIARALYNGADVYLFDDPLSAVDSHVAKHIFDNVIGPYGMLRKKVRILVTHSISFLPQVDKIVVMKNGSISEIGTYDEIVSSSGTYAEFLRSFALDDDVIDEDLEATTVQGKGRKRVASISSQGSHQFTQMEKMLHMKDHFEKQQKEKEKGNKMIQDEATQTGRVRTSVFVTYAKSVGLLATILVLLFALGSKFFLVGARIWLAGWSSDSKTTDKERDRYLLVYGLLGLGHCVCQYLGGITLTIGSCVAAKKLHNSLLKNVLRCPMRFFETTPMGRLTNRFSKDINVIDEDIPSTIDSFIGCLFTIVSVIFTISYSTPLFVIALVPLTVIYIATQRFYVASSRQLKRIESVKRSPIYNHFFESINGVSTIRAQQQQQRFIEESEFRIDDNQAAYAPSMYSNRWLAVRLEFVGNTLILFSALFAVIAKENITAGIAGLSISYSMQITQTLNWFVRMSSKLETDIVAVERVKEYTEIPTEAARIKPDNRPQTAWPENGAIHVTDYCVRYRDGLDYALNHIKFDVNPSEKVGLVGRTGAGKSTVAMALFRIIEAAEGHIKIDDVNIADIGLHDLRSRLTIIPQDPVLFSGSLRFNLDPFDEHEDDAVWNALEISHLKEFVASLSGQLQENVSEGGSNFSIGQRQLMCLARALLRKTKVLVLDEATAAVDMETDEFIQQTIREEFKNCTVFTIAHRLNTVMDYDRIMVLDRGTVVEFDSPQKLLQNRGIFYEMAKDANLL